jgi:hypothetical protein
MKVDFAWIKLTARTVVGYSLVVLAIAGSAHAGGGLPNLSAPEIDPGSMGTALTLLLSGAMLLKRRTAKN